MPDPGLLLRLGTAVGVLSQLVPSRIATLLAPTGLTYTQFALLNHLSRQPDQTSSISELAAALEINQPGVTKAVRRLAEDGVAAIGHDDNDARRRLVSLTTPGATVLNEANQRVGADLARWFDDWPDEEQRTFLAGIDRLNDWLDANRLSR